MSGERVAMILTVGDRLALWVLVVVAALTLRTLALRADRDPPSLIAPACVSTPSKVVKP